MVIICEQFMLGFHLLTIAAVKAVLSKSVTILEVAAVEVCKIEI